MSLRPGLALVVFSLAVCTLPVPTFAKEIIVHMKNQGAEGAMVFEPSFIKAAPGDVLRFKPTDPSHNAETIPTMLPAGAAAMKGAMNQEATLVVTKPGLYGIKCMPHYSMGMIALVQVGKVSAGDLDTAKALKLAPLAGKRMSAMLARVK